MTLPQASTVAGSLQLGARQALGPEPLSSSANIPALTVTSLLAVSLWSAFPLTLRTFRGSQASSTNTLGCAILTLVQVKWNYENQSTI